MYIDTSIDTNQIWLLLFLYGYTCHNTDTSEIYSFILSRNLQIEPVNYRLAFSFMLHLLTYSISGGGGGAADTYILKEQATSAFNNGFVCKTNCSVWFTLLCGNDLWLYGALSVVMEYYSRRHSNFEKYSSGTRFIILFYSLILSVTSLKLYFALYYFVNLNIVNSTSFIRDIPANCKSYSVISVLNFYLFILHIYSIAWVYVLQYIYFQTCAWPLSTIAPFQ